MRLPITIDGEVLYAEIPDEEINKLVAKKKKKTGYEKTDSDGEYYTITEDGKVLRDVDTYTQLDKTRFDNMNYFSDKTLAENMARAQKLWKSIHRRAVELCEPVHIGGEDRLTYIGFSSYQNNQGYKESICPVSEYGRVFGTVYFDTAKHCQQVIDEFYDELMWYFTEFKNRADM